MESLPDAFVHPAGLTRNLATGRVVLVGQANIAGREALVLEVAHRGRRSSRPTARTGTVMLAVDRATGIVLLLEARRRCRHPPRRGGHLEPDAPVRDEVFTVHVPADAVTIF
jgi:hypothetical protein